MIMIIIIIIITMTKILFSCTAFFFCKSRSKVYTVRLNGSSEKVFTFRYENVKSNLSFCKKAFLNAVAFVKLGETNKRKTIGPSHEKCTLVYLSSLPDEIQQKIADG